MRDGIFYNLASYFIVIMRGGMNRMKNLDISAVENSTDYEKAYIKRIARVRGTLSSILLVAVFAVGLCLGVSATNGDVVAISDGGALWTASKGQEAVPAVSYGLDVIAASDEVVFAGLVGNEISFAPDDIKRAMNLSEINYITVTKLPSSNVGTLYVGSVGVSEGQVITAANMAHLSFAAADDTKPCEAYMSISVNGSAYSIKCKMCFLPSVNYTPTVSLVPDISLNITTYCDTPSYGNLSAYDPEGDTMTYEIVKYAAHGRVKLNDKHTGAYVYIPDKGYTGSDSFVYVVRDEYGNYSTSAVVDLQINAIPSSAVYSDIEGSIYASAAIRMGSAGIMNGTQVGKECYFKPSDEISRVEFLVTAMSAAGITAEDASKYVNIDFADNSDIPVSMRGYVALAGKRGYITKNSADEKVNFKPHESISRAEAAVILSNIIGYANKTTVTAFADSDNIPSWADKALTSLYALGILDVRDGTANPTAKINRGTTAVWLAATMQLMRGK